MMDGLRFAFHHPGKFFSVPKDVLAFSTHPWDSGFQINFRNPTEKRRLSSETGRMKCVSPMCLTTLSQPGVCGMLINP